MLDEQIAAERRPHAHAQRHRAVRHRPALVLERPVDVHRRRRAQRLVLVAGQRLQRRRTRPPPTTPSTTRPSLINWPFLGDISKFQFRVAKKFDRGLLPYTLAARSDRPDGRARDVRSPTTRRLRPWTRSSPSRSARRLRRLRGRRASASPPASNDVRRRSPSGPPPGRQPRRPSTPSSCRSRSSSTPASPSLDALDNTTYPFDQVTRDIFRMQAAVRRARRRVRRTSTPPPPPIGGDRPHVVRHQLQPAGVQEGPAAAPAVLLPRRLGRAGAPGASTRTSRPSTKPSSPRTPRTAMGLLEDDIVVPAGRPHRPHRSR